MSESTELMTTIDPNHSTWTPEQDDRAKAWVRQEVERRLAAAKVALRESILLEMLSLGMAESTGDDAIELRVAFELQVSEEGLDLEELVVTAIKEDCDNNPERYPLQRYYEVPVSFTRTGTMSLTVKARSKADAISQTQEELYTISTHDIDWDTIEHTIDEDSISEK